MVSLLQGVNDATGIFIPFYLCTFAFALGIVVLAWGLAAARAISPVMAGCIGLGAVLLGRLRDRGDVAAHRGRRTAAGRRGLNRTDGAARVRR